MIKIPWQFAGNEELYIMAVRAYLLDLAQRSTAGDETGIIGDLLVNVMKDMQEMSIETTKKGT